eukprot:Plantae.Rhodophyta-Palmaria_palmata.ctg222.p1 GENE.Plantae.Rhodophyta-Palmaria_palmata.ctg222~~Plantae.Rhodophyta-Palmaria_palmata.ctg222.p1  ORF type:complete len:281 (+),score=25.14 Plantae.Rhodophyta-Palmaria_palmata.ctg222:1324-2166(+)
MRVKFSKCFFVKREVTSLGHTIKHNAIRPSDELVDAISELCEPTDGNGLCLFIGVANYFRQHILDLSNNLLPLFEVLSGLSWNQKNYKRQPVRIEYWDRKWGEAQRAAWEDAKAEIMNPKILAAPRHGAKKRLEMDASDAEIGGLLLQLSAGDEQWEPLAFTARKLQPSKLKFSITEKECLETVHGLRTWRHFVQGKNLEVFTDHRSLVWLMDHALMRGRLARWVWTIQNIPFVVVHLAGETGYVCCGCTQSRCISTTELPSLQGGAEIFNRGSGAAYCG